MSNESIKQQDISAAAWSACDIFRGVMNSSSYKDYILATLFLKYISDVWQDHYDECKKKYGSDKTMIKRIMDRERFVLPASANFYKLYEQRNENNIGELINKALENIERKNKKKLTGVFSNIDFNSESDFGKTKDRNRRLKQLLETFNQPKLNMSPSRIEGDIIGDTYIYLIERFASDAGKKAGEFYTPTEVSILVARLCQPQPKARICDPACGSGSLLIQAAKATPGKNYSLYGMEVNGNTWALCRMNMFIHNEDAATIEWCNTITDPQLLTNDKLTQFDNIVSNPPFSLDKWGAEQAENDPHSRFWRGTPPKSKGDYAFITHMIEAAKPQKGRVAVVVPHGVLFRGAAEKRIRQQLIDENLLDAVIGLPNNLFPTTSIPVAILVFDKSREQGGKNHNTKNVMFIDASKEFQPGKNQNHLTEENLDKILKTYQTRKSKKKYAHLATTKEIKENDYNLNIPRYVDTFEEEAEIDIDKVEQEIDNLEKELKETRTRMKTLLRKVRARA